MLDNQALIVIDMVNDFVDDKGSLTCGKKAQQIVPYIIKEAEKMLSGRGKVVFVNDKHSENEKQFVEGHWAKHCIGGTWGQKLYQPLQEWFDAHNGLDDNRVCDLDTRYYKLLKSPVSMIYKNGYDAFRSGLTEVLGGSPPQYGTRVARKYVDTVHLCGVCTDVCIFASSLGAYAAGYDIVVHGNGCAAFGEHELFLKHIELCTKAEIR